MGSSLTGQKINQTYDALLKVSDNGALDGTLQTITDGLGNDSALSLSTAGASVGGTLAVSGAATLSSTLAVTGNATFDTNTLFVDAANNRVGVGTLFPSERLTVSGSVSVSSGGLETFRTDGGTGLVVNGGDLGNSSYIARFKDFSNNDKVVIKGDGDISFRDSSANEAFYWDASAASLGIGIASINPAVKLQVEGVIASSGVGSKIFTDNLENWGSNLVLNSAGGFPTIFQTNGTERMRITSGGKTQVKANISDYSLTVENAASDSYGMYMQYTGYSPNSTNFEFITCADSTTTRFIVYSNGNVVNTNNSYGAISDAKLKENVVDASPKLEDLMQVQVRNFNYIGDDKKQLGVVAQELEEVFPSMIDESPDYEEVDVPQLDENGQEVLDENGEVVMTKEKVDLGTVTKSVKYSVFVPMLIKAIQELNAKVESLEAQLNA